METDSAGLRERLQTALGGTYTLERELEGGGMSRVFVAQDGRLGRRVVVKVLHPDLAAGLSAHRFEREIRLAARLQHPHVVPLLSAGELDGLPYYTMPFVEGESLRQRLAREGALPVPDAVRLVREVADALAYAHGEGIVHRDLKPENVLLSRGHAVVADFGVAKALVSATHGGTGTATGGAVASGGSTGIGVAVGTPAYMAPEQALGDPATDHRADLYALGVVAYELLAGTHPFAGRTPPQLVVAQVSELPAPLAERRPDVPPALAALVMRCLAKDPAARPPSADDFLTALEVAHTPGGGSPDSQRSAVRSALHVRGVPAAPRVPTRTLVIAGAALALTAAGGFALVAMRDGPELDPRRVVVAGFENQTGDPALDPLGRMAADWLTQGLTQTQLLDVVPSSLTLDARPAGLRDGAGGAAAGADRLRALAEATGAGTVVSGAYYRHGDTIRFHAQVADAEHGTLLRAIDPVSGPAERPAEVVERLRQRVTAGLAALLDPALAAVAWNTIEPPTFEAYREFMLGTERFARLEYSEAIAHFARAAALDSTSSQSTHNHALLWIAVSYLNQSRPAESDSVAQILTARRERLSALQRHILDWVLSILRGDLAGYLEAGRRVHAITPGSDLSELIHGFSAERTNRPKEAIGAFTQIVERGPIGGWQMYWRSLTGSYHMLGDHRRELEAARRGRERLPSLGTLLYEVRALAAMGNVSDVHERLDESLALPRYPLATPADVMERAALELHAHGHAGAVGAALERAIRWYRERPAEEQAAERWRFGLARTLYLAARWDEAQARFGQLATERPDNPDYLGHLGVLAARRSDRAEAERFSVTLERLEQPYLRGRHTLWRARIAARLGERERAMALLRESLQQGQLYNADLHAIIDFEPLRDYPAFRELLRPKG